jgi:hypothetical protein
MTKHKALEHVGSTIGASPETLRDWDKNILPQFGERKQIQAIARLIGKHASKSVEDPFGEIDLDHDDAPPGLHDLALDAHEQGDREMIHLTRQAMQFESYFREFPLDTIAGKMQSARRNEPPLSPA